MIVVRRLWSGDCGLAIVGLRGLWSADGCGPAIVGLRGLWSDGQGQGFDDCGF